MSELKIYFTTVKGRRESNEDRHNVILNINGDDPNMNPINFLAIYDGHGGNWVSKFLEANLPNYYMDKKFVPPFDEKYHETVFELVQSKLKKNPLGYSNGSTCLLNIMHKQNNSICMNIVNLGDSRMSTVDIDWNSKPITKDHKPDATTEKSRLEKMGGEIYEDTEGVIRIGDLSLSRAFGDADNAPYISQKPDIFYKKITPKTKYIVMACDGLWDIVESEDLGKVMKKIVQKNPANLAVELANYALMEGSGDNVSIIVIEVIH